MEPTELFTKAAEQINGDLTCGQNDEGYITIALPEGRKQGVRLSVVRHQLFPCLAEKTIVHIDSLVGPMNETIDPEYLLERMGDLVISRISILSHAKPELIALESRLPLDLTTPELLASAIMEAASCADSLEQIFFDVDLY